MAEILRSWLCLNVRCNSEFDAWEENPPCTECGCVRVQWLPGGGHTQHTAGAADAEFRALADAFKMTDMHSAVRGEAAKKVKSQPYVDQQSAAPHQFAPGFSAVAHPTQAVCVPSMNKVNFKAKAGVGAALPHSRTVPGVHANTRIEATHRERA
jgi:hypothetical protein